MSKVKITGTFKNSANNNIVLDVYAPSPTGFEFKQSFPRSFSKTFSDLGAGQTIYFDFSGHTTGKFELTVTGDVKTEFSKEYTNFFIDGSTFETV